MIRKIDFTKEENKKKTVYLAALLVVLFWIPLSLTKNLAYDQAYTLAMVRHSFKDIIELCSYDVHSPLYYFIAKIFYHVFFGRIFALKICSLSFMCFYLWILAFPFRKEFGNRMAFCMIVLSFELPTFQVHNTEPRMYSMALASFTCVAFLAYKILKEFKLKYAVMFFLASVFSTYIHTYTMLVTVFLYLILAAAIVLKKEERKKRIIWFLTNALSVSVLYLPWLFALLSQFRNKTEILNVKYGVSFYIKDILYENFSSIMYPKNREVAAWALIILVSMLILIIKKSPYLKLIAVGSVIYIVTAIIGIFLSVKFSPCFMGRYLFSLMPLILFAIASAMDLIKKKYIVTVILAFGVFAGIAVYRDRMVYEYDRGIDRYIEFAKNTYTSDDAVLYTEIHNNCLNVFYDDFYSFIYGYEDPFNPFENDETYTYVGQFDKIKGNIYLICYDDKNPELYINCDYDKIFGFHYLYYDVSVYRINDY